ncbi:MAG: porin [Gammaproteobacteria bacterium]
MKVSIAAARIIHYGSHSLFPYQFRGLDRKPARARPRWLSLLIVGSCLGLCNPVHADNWLMLQGTEPAKSGDRINWWGFVEPEYQYTRGSRVRAGAWAGQRAQFNQLAPDFDTHAQWNIVRARFGARGNFPGTARAVNYFFLSEFGHNATTIGQAGYPQLLDASVTLNSVPGLRLRVGQFKYPSGEEAFKAIKAVDYINFSTATAQLLQESYYDGDGSDPQNANQPNGASGAFRDIGIMAFDAMRRGDWEYSCALMVGNGNGLTRGDNDMHKDVYSYLSAEHIFAGNGLRREGLKFYIWDQTGKRTLTAAGAGTYARRRAGVGSTWRRGHWRAGAEYIWASGMMPGGTDGNAVPGSVQNAGGAVASYNILPRERAHGGYLDVGYIVTPPWELDLRYDRLDSGTKLVSNERLFTTWTLGVQYRYDTATRFIFNFESRRAEAPGLAQSSAVNQNLQAIDNRMGVQLIRLF